MSIATGSSTKNELTVALIVAVGLGGAIQGFQQGVNCNLAEVSVEKPGNETILLKNTGSIDMTLEIRKASYRGGVFDFAGENEQEVSIESGGTANLTLTNGKIMEYKMKSCRANSGLIRYGEIDPYDGGPDVSDTLERFN